MLHTGILHKCLVCVHMHVCVCVSSSFTSGSLHHRGLRPSRLLCPWNPLGKNSGVGCHFLLQGIFPTQSSNQCLLDEQTDSLLLSHQGSPPQSPALPNPSLTSNRPHILKQPASFLTAFEFEALDWEKHTFSTPRAQALDGHWFNTC